jgi:predicted murein hydrolase (TIGR00659 family)
MSAQPLFELWVYLAATPLAGLTLTLVAYAVAWKCYQRTRMHPVANPVLISVALIVAVLWASDTRYQTYFDGAQFVHFLLGPAVVGLAVPLAREWESVRKLALPITGALVVGSTVALVSTIGLAHALGATPATLLSLAPKSVTAPIAMGIAQKIGGVPALAAVFAVMTGVIGAALGKYVLDACGVRDWRARGFAMGLAAHGIGTARAFQVNADAGAFAGLAFALHGLLAAILFPLGWWLLQAAH